MTTKKQQLEMLEDAKADFPDMSEQELIQEMNLDKL